MIPRLRMYSCLFLALFAFVAGAGTPAAQPYFSDVTSQSGISFAHTGVAFLDKWQGTGAAWFDFDNDGDLDLYVTRRTGSNALYRNDGSGVFTNVAAQYGVRDLAHDGSGVAVADYDNDGWLDMYLANSDEDVLFRNVDTAFVDVTESAGVTDVVGARGTSAAWGDFDADGWLDLYIANHEHLDGPSGPKRDRLLRNNGDGTFEDVTDFIDADLTGTAFIGAWTDFDDDGDLDIFVVNDCAIGFKEIQLLENKGPGPTGWQFTDVAAKWNAQGCEEAMGIAIGDYNRDGLLDYFYSNVGDPVLLRNDGDIFSNQTLVAGIEIANSRPGTLRWTWGANFLDCDLDGWLDLYVASGSFRATSTNNPQANVLLMNDRDGTFTDMTAMSGADDIGRTRTSVFADYDGDGDPDMFVVNYEEAAHLYRNENDNGNHYLIVELRGVENNINGIGSKVTLSTADGDAIVREIHSGTSLGGGDDIAAYFGLGADARDVTIAIRWPTGKLQVENNVAVDRRVRIDEEMPPRSDKITTNIRFVSMGRNPFHDQIAFNIETRGEERVVVDVFDARGRRVETLFNGVIRPGEPRAVTFGGEGRPFGVYLFQARGQSETVSTKAVLVR